MVALYFRLIGARIRGQMQYKLSFWVDLIGFALTTGLEFAVIAILFTRFQSLGGWTIYEVSLLYSLTAIALSIAEMVVRGFDSPFETMMQRGTFDGVLTRPLGSFFQILTTEFQLRRLGRTAQALAVLLYAFAHLDIAWTLSKIAIIPLSILSGALVYTSLVVIGATICFWTIKTPEVLNAFTYGGNQLTSYPLSIYNRWLRFIFLAVVPVGLANYPATLLLLDRSDPNGLPAGIAWAAPLVALGFFAIARAFWQFGVTKYQGAGS